jgi:cobalt-zinc-cadmium efflux system outer membrane protein
VKALWIFLCVPLAAMPAPAQQGQPLTLSQALELAGRQNLDLAAARALRAVALAGVRIAGERPNPTANFSATRDSPHQSLFFDQPLEIGSRRRRRIDFAREQGTLTETDIAAKAREIRRSVREVFYALALARGVTAQQAEVLNLAERLLEIARARFEAGDVPQLEVSQAELEVARAQVDLQVAQQEEKVALSELNALLNEPATTPWELAGPLDSLPPRPPLSDLIERAGGSNAALERLGQERKVEQSRRSLLQAERVPNLGLQLGVDFNAPHDYQAGPRGQISMELPLFMRNQGEIAQSLAAEHAVEQETVAARRAVAGLVESAYFDLDARQSQVELYRQKVLPASQRLESLTEESYRAGKANILTVLAAERDARQVQREYLDSLFAAQTAFARLEETVGAPLD